MRIGAAEISRMFTDDLYSEVASVIKQAGYTHVTLDLEGYRRGSLNSVPIGFRQPVA